MKKLSVLFAAVMMLVTAGAVNAQKVASMDYEAVLAAMPETKKMTTDLDTFSKTKGDELQKQAEAFQKEVQQYQADGAKMTEAQRSAKEGELQKESVWAKFAYTASDGKTYQVDYYNLDISNFRNTII